MCIWSETPLQIYSEIDSQGWWYWTHFLHWVSAALNVPIGSVKRAVRYVGFLDVNKWSVKIFILECILCSSASSVIAYD